MIEKYSRVYASVDLDAIHSNMDHMKANIEPETKIISVIKADGYGHGAVPIARELESLDYIFGFATATVEEAFILRHSGITKPILILGYAFPYCYEEMIREKITPTVFRNDTLEELSLCALKMRKEAEKDGIMPDNIRVKIHIKVDTGMSRIGVSPDEEGLELVKKALSMPEIEVEGIFTHFARADEADKTAAKQQMNTFKTFIEKTKMETGYEIPVCHCSNSAGIIGLREANMNVVRAGVTTYGLWPSGEVERDIVRLMPAMELKSHIVYIKELKAGAAISYGGTFVTKRMTKAATIPVGYGDGYPRGLSNKGYVLVRGQKAPIIGRICMDQFMVDVTDIPEVIEGDEVTLIGRDGGESITMELLGELSGRFNYELACLIGKRVPRIYLKEGKVVLTRDYFLDFE
ncbi:alanine racemase [Kineothrix alysoides]|uniref:Alanine racemase n=1 Tax=Kineothrix alysoides TaxID=1469948 RepID=A0A4R1R3F4_9FIRM|nr:alanine racemase [Kineothrix alysoides]TCL59908.1 alanine racemase [Kineothrix alysoides]